MTCEQLAALYEEYALGVLESEERAEIEAHLARPGDQCIAGVAEARGMVSQLSHAAPATEPPAALRGKIMAAVRETAQETANATVRQPRPAVPVEIPKAAPASSAFPMWAWAAAAVLALITGYTVRQMNTQNQQLAELRKQMKLVAALNQALENQLEMNRMVAMVMTSPDSMPLKLMPKDTKMPMVHAYLHPHMGMAITADQMPTMPSQRTLQMWIVPKGGKPVSVAIFHPDSAGEIALVAPVTVPRNEIAALAVTDEPAGGSPQPTTPIAWMAAVN